MKQSHVTNAKATEARNVVKAKRRENVNMPEVKFLPTKG